METVGHIKAGQNSNGLPSMLGSLFLTKRSKKDGDDNFEIITQGLEEVKVSLPWVFHPEKNFKVGLISFVVINNIYKYRAEYKDGDSLIYLYPIQPFFNKMKRLPVIYLDAKTWMNALNFKIRAIGYFYVGDKLFDFKTESKFTIENFEDELKSLSGMNGEILAQCDLTLSYQTKLFKTKDSDHVSYVSMQTLSPREVVQAQTMPPKIISSLKGLENTRIKEEELLLKNAISLEESAKVLGTISIELDIFENNAFSTDILEKIKIQENVEAKKQSVQEKQKEIEEKISKNVDQLDLLLSKGVNQGMSKALIKKFGEKTFEECEKLNFDISELIKLLR